MERIIETKFYDLDLKVTEIQTAIEQLQEEAARLEKDKAYIDGVIKNNAEKAQYFANKTLRKVQKKIGFPERVR